MAETEGQRMGPPAGKARTVLSDVGQDEHLKQTAAVAKNVAEPAGDDRSASPSASRPAPGRPQPDDPGAPTALL